MNILIIRFSSLGDLVTLEPTFRAIRYFYEDSKISFLTTGIGKGLYQDSNYFDEYILHKSVFSSIQKLKNNKYDIVINLQCNKPSHYINFFLKKDLVVNKSYSFKDKLLGLKVKSKTIREIIEATKSISLNRIDKYFDEVQELIKLPVRQKSLLENLTSDKKYIAISTGTSERWLSKKWGIDNYSSLISKLIENNFQIILVGSALELEDSEILLKKYPQIISFVNKTDLTELKNLLANVDIFIGNDSGPTHIAAGVGTNTLTIFGSTDIKHCVKFMPYRGTHQYLKPTKDIKCHPCYKTKCPTNMECMFSIKPDMVYNKINIILNK
jgi:ADP-heptose:LPS heptosyltransferase